MADQWRVGRSTKRTIWYGDLEAHADDLMTREELRAALTERVGLVAGEPPAPVWRPKEALSMEFS